LAVTFSCFNYGFKESMMNTIQSGILEPVPSHASYLLFSVIPGIDVRVALERLASEVDGERVVVGVGKSLAMLLGANIPGLRSFPTHIAPGIEVPSIPAALFCWLRGEDRGELMHLTRRLEYMLSDAFVLDHVVDAFRYGTGLDLTGYEDGTENPEGEEAVNAATVKDAGKEMDGSSYVAVQQWLHDFDAFDDMSSDEQDNSIGRRKSDNEELDDAPESAHVKRTAQESFDPKAFLLRRSMPWTTPGGEGGLMFVAFGKSFDAFEAQLNRMVGNEDGITDALFRFTRPVTGSYFWCPPVSNGQLDLTVLTEG
jgi:putative iron-dependent peroxidase